jgi:hypothetical protein
MACQLVQRLPLFFGQLRSAHGSDDIVSPGESSPWRPCDICYLLTQQRVEHRAAIMRQHKLGGGVAVDQATNNHCRDSRPRDAGLSPFGNVAEGWSRDVSEDIANECSIEPSMPTRRSPKGPSGSSTGTRLPA